MNPDPDTALATIEAQLQDLQAALLASDPQALQELAQQLRDAAAALAHLQPAGGWQAWPQAPRQRVQAVPATLGMLRDQLARVLALTQQQAASLLPPLDGVTYGPQAATGPARIYRAPG